MNPGDGIEEISKLLQEAAAARYWPDYSKGLTQLLRHYQMQLARKEPAAAVAQASQSLSSLVEDPQPRLLRDLLTRTLTLAVASLLQGAPELAEEAELPRQVDQGTPRPNNRLTTFPRV
jgi:diguanylate cyclase